MRLASCTSRGTEILASTVCVRALRTSHTLGFVSSMSLGMTFPFWARQQCVRCIPPLLSRPDEAASSTSGHVRTRAIRAGPRARR